MHIENVNNTTTSAIEVEVAQNSEMFHAIIVAIHDRRVLKFKYKAETLARTFSPYILYLAKTGNFVVHGIQNSNPNGSSDIE